MEKNIDKEETYEPITIKIDDLKSGKRIIFTSNNKEYNTSEIVTVYIDNNGHILKKEICVKSNNDENLLSETYYYDSEIKEFRSLSGEKYEGFLFNVYLVAAMSEHGIDLVAENKPKLKENK